MAAKFDPPEIFDGALGRCITLARPEDIEDFIRRWNRAQMRNWAGHWRAARKDAALIKRPVEELAETTIELAVRYRESAKTAFLPRSSWKDLRSGR